MSSIHVTDLPPAMNPMPALRAWQATYSWPLRITWALPH